MSQENVELVRRSFEAFARRDKVAWLETCDPDCEVVPVGDWPETDLIRGREAAWNFFIAADEPWEPGPYELVEVIDGDDKVLARQRRDLRGKSSGVEVKYDYWLVVSFRDGMAHRLEWFADREAALEAAGLSEKNPLSGKRVARNGMAGDTGRAMSQENVELVKAAHPPTGTELTALFADDPKAPDRLDAVAPLYHPEFEFEVHGALADTLRGRGLPELIDAWREWMEPFEVYWTEVEDFVDAGGDQVLVILRDHGRPVGSDAEIESLGASLWTLRDRKIARIDFYPTREQGLSAAGLRE